MSFPRYSSVQSVVANTHNVPPHDAVMLAGASAGGRTDLIMFRDGAPRGMNGRVMNPMNDSTYGNTGPIVTIYGGEQQGSTGGATEILPIQIKGVGPVFGHTVFLLKQ